MRRDPRLAAALAAVAALALATLGDWWVVAWSAGLTEGGTAGISGVAATGGLAALLPGVVLAALLTTLTLDRAGRRLVGLVAVSAGLAIAALGFWGAPPGEAAVAQQVVVATLGGDWTLTRTGLPAAYGVAGVLVAAASGWLVARPPARRARGVRGAGADVTGALDPWKAMDQGLDPTDQERERS